MAKKQGAQSLRNYRCRIRIVDEKCGILMLQARILFAIALTVVTLLMTPLAARAGVVGAQGGNAALLGSLPQGRKQTCSGFTSKMTDDWRGLRSYMEKRGVAIGVDWVMEGFYNSRGGIKTGAVAASTLDVHLSIDTRKAFGLPGGKFYVDLENHAGQNPSTDLVGDLQVFDKQNTRNYSQIFELWYQQELFDGKLRLKIGKVDANTEFSVINNGLDFLNSSAQVTPTLFLLPTTPDPMPSVNIFFTPDQSCYAGFGAYYANRSEGFGNFTGSPQDAQLSDHGAFLIGETGMKWQCDPVFKNNGNLKLGAWGHTGQFTRLDGSGQQGAYGCYAILDQTLWQPAGGHEDARGVRSFLEYGRTQNSINAINWHVGGGIVWNGPYSGRPDDVTGICSQYAHISAQAGLPRSYELAMEIFYQLPVTGWVALMPDLQYIIHPGGQYPDALVGTLRLETHF